VSQLDVQMYRERAAQCLALAGRSQRDDDKSTFGHQPVGRSKLKHVCYCYAVPQRHPPARVGYLKEVVPPLTRVSVKASHAVNRGGRDG